jgi:hypothetical protein
MILRELALAWVRANCPRADVWEEVVQRLDEALRRGVGCSFHFGPKLTKAGKPYVVYCFCGELFAFQLTPRQAARLEVQDAMLVSGRGLTQHHHEPHPEPPVRLEQVEVDRADALDRLMPIRGTLKYRTDQWWIVPLAIQAACEPAGWTCVVLYHHLDGVPRGEGTVRFLMPPPDDLRDRQGRPFAGVLPLFFQVCIVGEPEKACRAVPLGPASLPGYLPPQAIQPPKHTLASVPKLGEPFLLPSPMPTLMTPETIRFSSPAGPWPEEPEAGPNRVRFRAISDIRAVLVEIE